MEFMSRPALAGPIDACDLAAIVEAQWKDEEIKSYSNLKEFLLSNRNCTTLCCISLPYILLKTMLG